MIAVMLAVLTAAPGVSARTLDNGAEIVALTRPSVEVATFRIAMRAGNLHDPAGKSGLARVSALTLFEHIQRAAPDLAMRLRLECGPTSTALVGYGDPSRLVIDVERILETALSARVAPKTFIEARDRALSERRRLPVDPLALAFAGAHRMLASRLGPSWVGGTREGIGSLESDDVKAWLQKHVTGSSLVVGIASPRAREDLEGLSVITSILRAGRRPTLAAPARPKTTGRRVLIVDRPGSREVVALVAQAGAAATRPDLGPLTAGLAAFSSSFTAVTSSASRRAHVTPIHLPLSVGHTVVDGTYAVALRTSTATLASGLTAVLSAFEDAARDGLDEAQARRGARRAALELSARLDHAEGRLAALVATRLLSVPVDAPFDRRDAAAAADREAINSALAGFLDPEHLVIVVVADTTPTLSRTIAKVPGIGGVEVLTYDALF